MSWSRIGKKILYPPLWLIVILIAVSAVSLFMVFEEAQEESPAAYASYVISFYTLSVVCVFLGRVFPKRYRAVKQKIYEYPLGNRYMTDLEFRNHVSLYRSLVINLLYAAVNIVSALQYRSAWFGVLAGYYVMLAVMRFLLVRYIHKHKLGEKRLSELRCARVCALILTMINLLLPGVVLMILYQNQGFVYDGMLIYVMAMYTFYMTVCAIIDLVKYRKYRNPILSMSKVIRMAAALVSMLALETAMLSQFGDEMSQRQQRIMVAATGAGVSLLVTVMAVYMVAHTTGETRRIKDAG